MDIYKKSIAELSDLLNKKIISSLEMTNYFIKRINSFDRELNSFITVDEENAQKCLTLIHQRCDEQRAGFILTTLGDDHGTKYDREQKL